MKNLLLVYILFSTSIVYTQKTIGEVYIGKGRVYQMEDSSVFKGDYYFEEVKAELINSDTIRLFISTYHIYRDNVPKNKLPIVTGNYIGVRSELFVFNKKTKRKLIYVSKRLNNKAILKFRKNKTELIMKIKYNKGGTDIYKLNYFPSH